MLLLIFFAFLGGLVTILSPCILPILPIVLSSSLTGGHRKPLGVVAGFIASFTFFTLFLATIVTALGIPADSLRALAIVVIGLMGVSLLLPQTQLLLEKIFSRVAALAPRTPTTDGFGSGVIVGVSLGLLWAPCVGPILASVITLAITSQVTAAAAIITLAYSLGTALPMLLITYSGRQLFLQVPWLLANTKKIQQAFGVVMILTALTLFYNLDRQFQSYILEKFPQYGAGLTSLEDNDRIRQELESLQNQNVAPALKTTNDQAPGFSGGTNWLNSTPLDLKTDLKGKVVLVDFWTYSCINCIRTLPYLRDWWSKYQDDGLVIVGVHSPEFAFEKVTANVEQALTDFEITYPIVQDNNFAIWQAYQNRYWPAKYLIDQDGFIRYTHFGEGKYLETENAIRALLSLEPLTGAELSLTTRRQSPEIYLGYERAANYSTHNNIDPDVSQTYALSQPLQLNEVGLHGQWLVANEAIEAQTDQAELRLRFQGAQAYLVLEPPVGGEGKIEIVVDDQPPTYLPITQAKKYDLITTGYGEHVLTLRLTKGVKAFAFTFGS